MMKQIHRVKYCSQSHTETPEKQDETQNDISNSVATLGKHDQTQATISVETPPCLEILVMPKCIPKPYFNFIGELKKLCVKITLLQAMKDVLIYAKTMRELCIKKSGGSLGTPPPPPHFNFWEKFQN
jgi:hypothetical protein